MSLEPNPDPFILSLLLDDVSFTYLNGLRQQHFPAERNHLAAHVTLFHALPGDPASEATIRETLAPVCAETEPFAMELPGLRSLGRGVAVEVRSAPLIHLRNRLAAEFETWLTPQDRQKFQPHVTIQNKVTPEAARNLLERLSNDWKPLVCQGQGLQLWRYRGGPWEVAGTFLFGDTAEKFS
jgi:2'-5' RNA ligase